MPQKLSDLPVGGLVKDIDTKYYGKPIVFQVADKNHAGYPENSVTLITEKIICLKVFDAKEPNNSDSNRKNYGNNRYLHSNIRLWMNSDKPGGQWYTAQHTKDQKPDGNNVWDGKNPYDAEAGFLTNFSAKLKSSILPTTLIVAKNTVTDGGGSETVTDKIFNASNTEVGLANENGVAEGVRLALFSGNESREAKPTPEAVQNSNYNTTSLNVSSTWYWWLRSPNAAYSYSARSVIASGALDYNYAYGGDVGVRPLLNLSSEIFVSDTPDTDGAHTVVWNHPPTAPTSITVPEIRGGESASITWGTATDADGSVSGYALERALNGGSFEQIYKGINRQVTDTVAFGVQSVQYRVRAYDNENAYSSYTSSPVITVVNNTPPKISGSDSNLGQKTGAFSVTYTVSDDDEGQTVTVVEKIDGVTKREFQATLRQQNTFNVSSDEWKQILNGEHTMSITATDNVGGTTTRTHKFTKNATKIELTLETPLDADEKVTKAITNITRQIPIGATFTVLLCNNGFDTTPTWEDATQSILYGDKFFFSNETKTAEKWGFNFMITVDRGTATGDCFIQGIGGNFE